MRRARPRAHAGEPPAQPPPVQPRAHPCASGRGFTLVELLVVLIVLGIAAGLVYVRMDADPKSALEREGLRLAGALEHAAQLAQWHSEMLAFSADASGYRFLRRTNGDEWIAVSDDDVLREHALPSPVLALARSYSGQSVAPDALIPLRASGRNDPYSVELVSGPWSMLLAADPLNRVQAFAATSR